MKWWKKFWRLRKQEDTVKIVLLLFLLGMGFFIYGLYNGVRLYQTVQTPVEYVIKYGAGIYVCGKRQELEYLRKLKEMNIKYALGMSGICLFCAYMLWKARKEK